MPFIKLTPNSITDKMKKTSKQGKVRKEAQEEFKTAFENPLDSCSCREVSGDNELCRIHPTFNLPKK